jgi:hypothetical protein
MELIPTLLMVVKVSNAIDPDESYELLVAAANEDEARKLVSDRTAGGVDIGYVDNLGIHQKSFAVSASLRAAWMV